MAKVLRIDGTNEIIEDANLEKMQEIVGGFIQTIKLPNNEIMVVNEEGMLLQLPVNELATKYLSRFGKLRQEIFGNVIICKTNEMG